VSASFVCRGQQIYGSLRDSTLLIKSDGHPVEPNTVSANERVSLKTVVFAMAFSGSCDLERSGALCRMRSAPTRLATPESAGGEI
jgi:hypothetical protein